MEKDKVKLEEYLKQNKRYLQATINSLCYTCKLKALQNPSRSINDYCNKCSSIMNKMVSKVNNDLTN